MCMYELADEAVTMLHTKECVARKEHTCNECQRIIRKSESYLNEAYIFDGEKTTHKTCAHCQIARQWLTAECSGWVFGAIYEDVAEHVQEGYGFGVVRLAAGMKRKWTRKDGRAWPIPNVPDTSDGYTTPPFFVTEL